MQEPVGRGGPCLDAALPFGGAAFLVVDPPSGAGRVAQLHALEEAEHC
ncbi:hypothetical protein OIE75_00775 [Streptomyces sp. NBC_01723]|nr:hypothetical protein [Streptomyces sp. NBC_01723]